MKQITLAAGFAALLATTAAGAADIGVSVGISQPGFYGRIDIGGYPVPQLIYAEPRIVSPKGPPGRPLYLHVPPGHAKDWHKHCHKYGACSQPVYFVQERWYQEVYAPRQGKAKASRAPHDRSDAGRHGDGYRDDRRRGEGDRRDDDRRGGGKGRGRDD